MNIQTDRQYTVFKQENQYGALYSIGLSKKQQDGNYLNGYVRVQFKKGVELENKTRIYIRKGWLDFYKSKNNETMLYVFVSEFETAGETINKTKAQVQQEILKEVTQDPFEEYYEQNKEAVDNLDDSLPF